MLTIEAEFEVVCLKNLFCAEDMQLFNFMLFQCDFMLSHLSQRQTRNNSLQILWIFT